MIGPDLIKTRIMIFGSNGMLGQRLAAFFADSTKYELLCLSGEDSSFVEGINYLKIDITAKASVRQAIMNFVPDYVINVAAFTNVDRSEIERETAWKVNVNGVENIAFYCWTIDAHLIHLSTDYIFDGKNGPYSEDDKPYPINYYGRTKLAAENSIRTSGVRFSIIRSNVFYGPVKKGRPDFVKWVFNSLKNKQTIRIVTDQINNPAYIDDVVGGINKIVEFKKEGIYNLGGAELLSRYEFALRIADYFRLDGKLIQPVLTKELNQLAPRPLKSGLINLKANTELGYKPRSIGSTLELMKPVLDC